MRKVRFDLSKYENTSVKSFVMRECNGKDEEQAAKMAEAKGSQNVSAELLRLCFVEADGQPVNQGKPFFEYDEWNSKTRFLAMQAFTTLNMVKDEEVQDFLAKAEEV